MGARCFTVTIRVVNGNLLVGIISEESLGNMAARLSLENLPLLICIASCHFLLQHLNCLLYYYAHKRVVISSQIHKYNVLLNPCDDLSHCKSSLFVLFLITIQASSSLHPSIYSSNYSHTALVKY